MPQESQFRTQWLNLRPWRKVSDWIHSNTVTQVLSSSCKAVIWNNSPAWEAGWDKSSSCCATQSSPDCTGTRSASSESPNDSASNGWSDNSTVVSTVGQSGRVHCLHGVDGALESPSAFPCSRPAWCMIENWNCCSVCNHRAIIPSVSLNRCSHTRDLWSVLSVNFAPRKYERNCIHIETAASISLLVVQYFRCDGRKPRLQ